MSSCPVRQCIDTIRSGGYDYDPSNDANMITYVKLGSAESVQTACDNIQYLINQKKIAWARGELNKPVADTRRVSKFNTYGELYMDLITNHLQRDILYSKFISIIELIARIDKYTVQSITNVNNISVTLPTLLLAPSVDKIIQYRPDILTDSINKIIVYFNQLNINSILTTKITYHQELLPAWEYKLAPSTTVFSSEIEKKHLQELEVYEYVYNVEKLHCKVSRILDMITTSYSSIFINPASQRQ